MHRYSNQQLLSYAKYHNLQIEILQFYSPSAKTHNHKHLINPTKMDQCSVLTIHPNKLPASSNRNPPISHAFREIPPTKNTSSSKGKMQPMLPAPKVCGFYRRLLLIGPLYLMGMCFSEDQKYKHHKNTYSLDSRLRILFTTPYSVVNTICEDNTFS